MKNIVFILLLGIIFVSCQKSPPKLETTVVSAKTMVCQKCADRVEKAVKTVEGVNEVNVDLQSKTVKVGYDPLQTNLTMIEIAISDAGYNANDRKRNEEAYEALDECCKAKQ